MYFAMYLDVNGEGVQVESFADFDAWLANTIDDVSPEYRPKFVSTVPESWRFGSGALNEYVLIRGAIIVPEAVSVVQTYRLPN